MTSGGRLHELARTGPHPRPFIGKRFFPPKTVTNSAQKWKMHPGSVSAVRDGRGSSCLASGNGLEDNNGMSDESFLVISRGKWDADAPKDEIEAAIGRFYEWLDGHIAAGRMSGGSRLKRDGAIVTRRGIVTDAPLTETKEVIGGYWFIHAPDLEAAARLVAENPCIAYGIELEIRPLDPERASVYALTNETPGA